MPSRTSVRQRAPLPTSSGANAATGIVAGPFRVSRVVFAPGRLSRHYHERACLTAVLRGSFAEKFAARTIECRAGEMLFKPAGEAHSDEFAGSAQIIIEPDERAAIKLAESASAFERVLHERGAIATALAHRIARELEDPDAFTPLAVEGLALELVADALRTGAGGRSRTTPSHPPAWLARVRERLDDEQRRIAVSELAALADVHPAYLSRLFRRCYGLSIGQYVRRARLDGVARKLLESDEPLSIIAIGAGFADQSHLTRVFRAYRGLTPGQYRLRFSRRRY
jgi:AraC family transcriptional regulator